MKRAGEYKQGKQADNQPFHTLVFGFASNRREAGGLKVAYSTLAVHFVPAELRFPC